MVLDGEMLWAAVLVACSGLWLGGLLTVPLLAATTSRLIAPTLRTEFFVMYGRRFAVLMGAVLVVALLAGTRLVILTSKPLASGDQASGALASGAQASGALASGALALVVTLVVSTAVGIVQARRMSALRRAAGGGGAGDAGSANERVLRRNAAVATALRSFIGLVSVVLLVVATLIVAGG